MICPQVLINVLIEESYHTWDQEGNDENVIGRDPGFVPKVVQLQELGVSQSAEHSFLNWCFIEIFIIFFFVAV